VLDRLCLISCIVYDEVLIILDRLLCLISCTVYDEVFIILCMCSQSHTCYADQQCKTSDDWNRPT